MEGSISDAGDGIGNGKVLQFVAFLECVDPDSSLELVIEKFKASAKFFQDAKLIISFKGRNLSEQEIIDIVDGITKNSSIQILGVMEENSEVEEKMKNCLDVCNETDTSELENLRPISLNINMNDILIATI